MRRAVRLRRADVESLTGTISTVHDEGVDLRARARRDARAAPQARIRFATPVGGRARTACSRSRCRASSSPPTPCARSTSTSCPSSTAHDLGRVELHGPFAQLALDAELDERGRAGAASRACSPRRGAQVTLSSTEHAGRASCAGRARGHRRGHAAHRRAAEPDAGDAAEPETRLRARARVRCCTSGFAVPALQLDGALHGDRRAHRQRRGQRAAARASTRAATSASRARSICTCAPAFRTSARDPNLQAARAQRARPARRRRARAEREPRLRPARAALRGQGRAARLRYGAARGRSARAQGSARGDPERPELRLDLRGEQRARRRLRARRSAACAARRAARSTRPTGSSCPRAGARSTPARRITARARRLRGRRRPDRVRGRRRLVARRGAGPAHRPRTRASSCSCCGSPAARSASRRTAWCACTAPIRSRRSCRTSTSRRCTRCSAASFWLRAGRADAHVTLTGDLERARAAAPGRAARRRGDAGRGRQRALLHHYGSGTLEADGEVDLGERGMLHLRGGGASTRGDPRPGRGAALRQLRPRGQQRRALDRALAGDRATPASAASVSGNLRVRGHAREPGAARRARARPAEPARLGRAARRRRRAATRRARSSLRVSPRRRARRARHRRGPDAARLGRAAGRPRASSGAC